MKIGFWHLPRTIVDQEMLIKQFERRVGNGIIGKSNFTEWLKEFEYIYQNQQAYDIFKTVSPDPWLTEEIEALKLTHAQLDTATDQQIKALYCLLGCDFRSRLSNFIRFKLKIRKLD